MLNEKQLEAVEATEGPLLILAGAGSGKTTVLTERTSRLVTNGVAPWNILAITFTNKAATELKERITHKVGFQKSEDIWASTFHSMCIRILKRNALKSDKVKPGFTIYDTKNTLDVIKKICDDMGLDKEQVNPKNIAHAISMLKNEMVDYETFAARRPMNKYIDWEKASREISKQVREEDEMRFKEIYKQYQERLQRYVAVDFDDIMLHTVDLFMKNPDVLEYYQDKFKYIMVDEYQDTNQTQYTLVKLLAAKYRNLAVVGDDGQAIYSWRGSDIRNILNFQKDYPEAKLVKLEENYRCSDVILEAANQVISHNKNQFPKVLYTRKTNGEKITNMLLDTDYEEAQYVSEEIQKRIRKGAQYEDMAILFRTNSQSRSFEETFIRNNIPYKVIGGTKFFDRKEIRDMVAYIKFIFNPNDVQSFERIVNFPKRGIGPKTVDAIIELANQSSLDEVLRYPKNVKLTKKAAEGIQSLLELVDGVRSKMKTEKVDALLRDLVNDSGVIAAIMDSKDENKHDRKDNIYGLVNMAAEMVYRGNANTLEDFLEHISLYSDTDEIEDENVVKLMTIHASKGLEFGIVFIVGLEENIFPHERSLRDNNIEEERRLFYVAITRAKWKLYLTNCISRRVFGKFEQFEHSRFLTEFDFKLLE